MAGIEDNQDWTDSPAVPTENPLSLHGLETQMEGQPGVTENMRPLGLDSNSTGKTPDAVGAVLCDRDPDYTSETVNLAQQKRLDKFNCGGPQTSGGTRPNVDEELCEKRFLKIGDIGPDVFMRACNLLNIHRVQGRDWRSLAGKLGYNVTDVKIYEKEKNPAESMLYDWNDDNKHNNLDRLVQALQEMRRQDVTELLQKEIERKGESCNCPECGHIV